MYIFISGFFFFKIMATEKHYYSKSPNLYIKKLILGRQIQIALVVLLGILIHESQDVSDVLDISRHNMS